MRKAVRCEGTAAVGECSDGCEVSQSTAGAWKTLRYYRAHRVHQSLMEDPNQE